MSTTLWGLWLTCCFGRRRRGRAAKSQGHLWIGKGLFKGLVQTATQIHFCHIHSIQINFRKTCTGKMCDVIFANWIQTTFGGGSGQISAGVSRSGRSASSNRISNHLLCLLPHNTQRHHQIQSEGGASEHQSSRAASKGKATSSAYSVTNLPNLPVVWTKSYTAEFNSQLLTTETRFRDTDFYPVTSHLHRGRGLLWRCTCCEHRCIWSSLNKTDTILRAVLQTCLMMKLRFLSVDEGTAEKESRNWSCFRNNISHKYNLWLSKNIRALIPKETQVKLKGTKLELQLELLQVQKALGKSQPAVKPVCDFSECAPTGWTKLL